jgi:hypothetical protein
MAYRSATPRFFRQSKRRFFWCSCAPTYDQHASCQQVKVDLDSEPVRGQRRQGLKDDLGNELSSAPERNVDRIQSFGAGYRIRLGLEKVDEPCECTMVQVG